MKPSRAKPTAKGRFEDMAGNGDNETDEGEH